MNNYDYFEYSKNFEEEVLDHFYEKENPAVITVNCTETNKLIEKNNRMIDCITAFKVLISNNCTVNDENVCKIVNEIVDILLKTDNINCSAFVQFFMVNDSTYSYFKELNQEKRFNFVYEMLVRYCKKRHDMYLSHGYSNSILQVVYDSYSHKRDGKLSINKVLEILAPYGLKRIKDINETESDDYYFLPDKGDSKLFEQFIIKYNLKMEHRESEQNKYPDMVFKHNKEYYICEFKHMKGNGGGQDKQMSEVINFIRYKEEDKKFHFIVFMDGVYSNTLFESERPKIVAQRRGIEDALSKNQGNYFVNTAGLKKLTKDLFE